MFIPHLYIFESLNVLQHPMCPATDCLACENTRRINHCAYSKRNAPDGNSRGSRLDGEVRALDSATRFPEALPVELFSAGTMPGIRLASASKRPPRRPVVTARSWKCSVACCRCIMAVAGLFHCGTHAGSHSNVLNSCDYSADAIKSRPERARCIVDVWLMSRLIFSLYSVSAARDNGALSKVLQPLLLFVTIPRPMRKAYEVLNLL